MILLSCEVPSLSLFLGLERAKHCYTVFLVHTLKKVRFRGSLRGTPRYGVALSAAYLRSFSPAKSRIGTEDERADQLHEEYGISAGVGGSWLASADTALLRTPYCSTRNTRVSLARNRGIRHSRILYVVGGTLLDTEGPQPIFVRASGRDQSR